MAAEEKYHIIQKGETLTKIAKTYGTTVDALLELNPKIVHRDLIFAGDKIKVSGTPDSVSSNSSQRVITSAINLQNGTNRTLFVTWTWDNKRYPTKHYEVQWQYDTGNDLWFSASSNETTTNKYSVYTPPENAIEVCVRVKAVPNNNEFTASWSGWHYYSFGQPKPDTPPAPTSTLTGTKLKMELSNSLLQVNDVVQLQVLQDDATTVYDKKLTVKNIDVPLVHECTVAIGHRYRVRCRIIRKKVESDWSSYTSNMLTIPAAPTKITKLEAKSSTSVYIEWPAVTTGQVDSYDIQYATDKRYFDGSNSVTTVNNITQNHYELTGLESGQTYFFRVRAVNEKGPSDWLASGKIKSIIIGKAPAAPTTWSSTTTAIVGEPLTLYWVHNAEDNSKPTFAELEVYINDVKQNIATIQYSTPSDEEAELTYSYSINTSEHPAGSKIRWRVRTAGITNNFGDWSIERSIDIYAQPTLTLQVTNSNGTNLSTLTSFPIKIKATAGPNTQAPIGYHIDIIADSAYETTDNFGNPKTIVAGTSVYSKHFDTTAQLSIDISASDVDLENGAEYTIKCTVAMNSGLTVEASREFEVSWTDDEYWPNASIIIDQDTLTSTIQPYCKDSDGALISGVLLSVYRREFDGGFTEIAKDLNNEEGITISDPHPALDYARYRVTATSKTTGAISYYDLPGVRVGGKAVIIQWDEEWTNFDSYGIDTPVQQPWTGSMLKLPYNIKVSDSNKPDVELIEYIGRNYPVAYYGTHRGGSQNWSVDVPSDDKETIYALRRLMNWMNNVYVREPSGSGYWANVKVSFSQDQTSVVIPVTIDVTRVEGGM